MSVYGRHSLKHQIWPKKQEIFQIGKFCELSNFRKSWRKYELTPHGLFKRVPFPLNPMLVFAVIFYNIISRRGSYIYILISKIADV